MDTILDRAASNEIGSIDLTSSVRCEMDWSDIFSLCEAGEVFEKDGNEECIWFCERKEEEELETL